MAEANNCSCSCWSKASRNMTMRKVTSWQYEEESTQNKFVIVTDNEIMDTVRQAVSENTCKQTRWCYGMRCSWWANRIEKSKSDRTIEVPPEC